MKAVFWRNGSEHERVLSEAIAEGYKDCEIRSTDDWKGEAEGDLGIFCGAVKSKPLCGAYAAAGKRFLQLDKGYTREGSKAHPMTHFWRVGINAEQPTDYLFRSPLPDDRWRFLVSKNYHRLKAQRMPRRNDAVLYLASSEKYHRANALPSLNDYAAWIFKRIRENWDGRIIFCPKPQSFGKDEIKTHRGVEMRGRRQRIKDLCDEARVAVVHGSGAGVDCFLRGVPIICLGPSIVRPMAAHDFGEIKTPFFPTDEAREQWACNFAYAQWTAEEMRSGEMMEFQKWCITQYDL